MAITLDEAVYDGLGYDPSTSYRSELVREFAERRLSWLTPGQRRRLGQVLVDLNLC